MKTKRLSAIHRKPFIFRKYSREILYFSVRESAVLFLCDLYFVFEFFCLLL